MEIIIIIVILVAFVFCLIWFIKQYLFKKEIIRNFKKCNVIVDGKKGSGKDLIFQEVIRKRNDFYYSNIDYGYKGRLINISKDLSVYPNTYKEFILNKVDKVDRKLYEKKDVYISDGGIFLPSHMDSVLHKSFPSFPILYALSRHLYANNIHVNVQNFNRLWKALREQADYFIHVKKTIKLPLFLFVRATTYDKYESAVRYLEPVKTRMFNKYSKAEIDIYNATYGEIKAGWIIIRKKDIKYDTRAFEKIVLKGDRLEYTKCS